MTINIYFRAGAVDTAWCEVNGVRYEAKSRHGAVHALCRKLAQNGAASDRWMAFDEKSGVGYPAFQGASTEATARWKIRDDDAGIRAVRWHPHPGRGE